jgi:hypothetical protein
MRMSKEDGTRATDQLLRLLDDEDDGDGVQTNELWRGLGRTLSTSQIRRLLRKSGKVVARLRLGEFVWRLDESAEKRERRLLTKGYWNARAESP